MQQNNQVTFTLHIRNKNHHEKTLFFTGTTILQHSLTNVPFSRCVFRADCECFGVCLRHAWLYFLDVILCISTNYSDLAHTNFDTQRGFWCLENAVRIGRCKNGHVQTRSQRLLVVTSFPSWRGTRNKPHNEKREDDAKGSSICTVIPNQHTRCFLDIEQPPSFGECKLSMNAK